MTSKIIPEINANTNILLLFSWIEITTSKHKRTGKVVIAASKMAPKRHNTNKNNRFTIFTRTSLQQKQFPALKNPIMAKPGQIETDCFGFCR